MDAEHFKTQEAILAFCLDLAGCEFLDANQPCANIYDAEMLRKLGYSGETLWMGAQHAWQDQKKGHVEYILKQAPRLLDLIRAYRDQESEVAKAGGNATTLRLAVAEQHKAGAILDDEYLVRSACIDLKTRIDFMAIYKKMVPILRIPNSGKSKNFDTTILSKGKSVQAKGVEKPGFNAVSLNASEKTRKHLGL